MDARPGDNVPAGFLRRAAAYLIDSLVVTLLWGLAFVILCIIAAVFDPQGKDSDTYGAILLVAAPVLWFLYQWACNSIGASIGKKRMSLAVRRMPEDTRPGVGRGLVRTVGQVLGALPLGLGFWWALWDAKKQGWHDKMAGTHVVRLERAPAPASAAAEPRVPKWLPPWMRSRYAKYADPLALKKALEEPLPIDAASTPLDMPLWPGPQPLYALYFLAGIVPLVAFRLAFGFHLDLPTLLLIAGDLLLAIGGGVELAGLNRRLQVSGEGIRLVKIYGTRTISWLQVQRVEAKPDLLSMRAIGQGIRVSWDCRLVPLEKRKDIIIAIRARLPLGVPIQEWPKGGQLLAWAFRSAVTFAAMGLFLAASFMGASGFTGAIQGPCTGDQLAECLEPQVELQSISRPSCDGSGRRVCLVPLGQIRPDLVQNLVDHWGQYGLSITVLTPSAVPSDIVNPGRGQFDAPTLIDYMGSLFPDAFSDPSAVVIGLTPVDLFDQGSHFRYVFGVKGTTANPKAIISTLRMNPAAYGESPNDELLFSRARKLLARYIGLLYYGLPLSSDRRSPLYESIRGPADLDSMDEDLPLPQAR